MVGLAMQDRATTASPIALDFLAGPTVQPPVTALADAQEPHRVRDGCAWSQHPAIAVAAPAAGRS